jgi:hypothetical protein
MSQIVVIAPRDIYENIEGKSVKVVRKGERISVEDAKRYKVMPISVNDPFATETK